MPIAYNLVSRDAQLALNEFSSQFDAALAVSDADQWARRFGLYNTSRSIRTTYPIPIDAAGYKERKGDDKLRELYERSLSMKPREWVDGVECLASVIEAPDFIGWAGAPARMAREAARQPNKLVAEMLAANPLLDFYRQEFAGGSVASAINLFHNSHPVNVLDSSFGNFGNDHAATAIDATMLSAAKLRFRQRKGPNGEPMGLKLTTLIVPAAREEEARNFLESDNMIIALQNVGKTENVAAIPTNNRHKGTVELVVAPELTSDNLIYALDSSAGCFPWVIQDGGAPEEIRYEKTDAKYKDSGKLGVKYVLLMAAAAALPHAIERIDLS